MDSDGFYGRNDRLSYLLALENASRLQADPSLASRASEHLERFTAGDPHQARAYGLWRALLDGPLDGLVAALTERSARGDYVRQTAPAFPGMSDEVRAELIRRARRPLDAKTDSETTQDQGLRAPMACPPDDAALTLAPLVARLKAATRAEAIILFGSRARGDAKTDSDYDLCVVIPQEENPANWSAWRIHEKLGFSFGLPVDLIVGRPSDLVENKDELGSIAYDIAREGRLLDGTIDGFFVPSAMSPR